MNIEQRSSELIGDLVPRRLVTLEALRLQVSRVVGRTVRIQHRPLSSYRVVAPTGLWISEPDTDWIVVDSTTSEMHQSLIACHEFGHILWGHEPLPLSELDGGISRETIAALIEQEPSADVAVLGRCGTARLHPWTPEWLDEAEAEQVGRRLAAPLIEGPEDRLAAVLEGEPRHRPKHRKRRSWFRRS